tara:strand:- start:103 stop:345 length:243 start_codon:yes stop_codon:yes gene_type:complete
MGLRYKHNNSELDLTNSAKASLYDEGKLVFKGDGYIAIKMFIALSGHNKSVIKRFKSQLDQREHPKWKETPTEKKDGPQE